MKFDFVQEYWLDAWQRSVLTLDVLRERGNTYFERAAKTAPNVLSFAPEVLLDGRTFERPVNYGLVRILPPEGTAIDPRKPPVVVVDPRAGHGPGIGGMKPESEIGEALKAGHACYFVGFLPRPMPGQTLEDVCRAEARFISEVAARHEGAEGKPIVIANCQAGWQTMIMAAIEPDVAGPILLAGSPLSYWAGVRGKNPMRYTGGLLGGTWLTALAGDLGAGIFDGAHLVANFESLNPANTYWTKPYNLYSKVDTEGPRFLDFETWWGSPVLLNAGEMQWIADSLFVGDHLAAGEIRTSEGVRVDLRAVKSPVVVFCSWGDDITPPQQALGWILDLYDDVAEIMAAGRTIVYATHESVGHLGIFVSGKVASREHKEFVSCMDMIDAAPPGLYEAVISEVGADTANPELAGGTRLMRLEARTLEDIRAFGGNDAADERRFATAARVSEINLGFYRRFLQTFVRASADESRAEAMRSTHPNRLRFAAFSDRNPAMAHVARLAADVRADRKSVAPDNPLSALERASAAWIENGLKMFGAARDAVSEATFLSIYGSPVLQAAVGLGDVSVSARSPGRDVAREAALARARSDLDRLFETGGAVQAVARALVFVNLPDGAIDERGYRMAMLLRDSQPARQRLSPAAFKTMMREQLQLVLLDEERAVRALPKLLSRSDPRYGEAIAVIRKIAAARGAVVGERRVRLARVESLLGAAPSLRVVGSDNE